MELTTHKLRISQSTVNTILSRAQGHYKSILLSAGADETIFKTKNLECPWCAGVDRFSYTDKFGKGDSFCRHCGYHSGVDLLMKIKKFGYVDALRFMARFLNLPIHEEKTYRVTKTQEQSSPVEEVWAASHALGEKDSAYVYLRSRGLKKCFPAALRASNRLRYAQLSEDGRSWDHSFYEGLVAEIVNSEGHRVSLHRTYLDKGRKAPVKAVKKVLGKELSGCAVRLAETDESGVLGLARELRRRCLRRSSSEFRCGRWLPHLISATLCRRSRSAESSFSVTRTRTLSVKGRLMRAPLKSNSGIPTLRSKSVCPSNRDVTGMTFSWLKTKQASVHRLVCQKHSVHRFLLNPAGPLCPCGAYEAPFFYLELCMTQVLNEFVSLESFGFMQDGSLLGYRLKDIEPELRCLIPRLDPSYVFEKDALSIMSAWFEIGSGEPLFISGPHGSGKTSFVNQYCARVNAPVISITARARLDRTDLIGGYVIDKDKSMRFADGPLTRAWRHGCVFLVNEMSAAPPDLWLSVNELLEGSPLYIPETGEVIHPHPRTRIVMTDNLRGLTEDYGSRYVGRFSQDPAVLDRFWKMRMDYMGEEAEVSLLEATTPELEVRGMSFEEWRKEFSVRLRRAADRVRQAYCRQTEDGAVAEATISTRVLLRFRDLLLLSYRSPAMKNEPRAALRRAMKIALTDCLEEAGALAVEKLVELEIGDIGKHIA